jgi:hypothetical protein
MFFRGIVAGAVWSFDFFDISWNHDNLIAARWRSWL